MDLSDADYFAISTEFNKIIIHTKCKCSNAHYLIYRKSVLIFSKFSVDGLVYK